jgi:hypothetical protein
MGRPRRFGVAIGGACLIVVVVGLFWPGERPAPEPGADEAGGRGAPTEPIAVLRRKVLRKDAVLKDVIAGRRTLAQAVVSFREIEAQFPDPTGSYRRYLAEQYPGYSFEECLARNIVAQVEGRLQSDPEQDRSVLARLRAELAEYVKP